MELLSKRDPNDLRGIKPLSFLLDGVNDG
jgi:hypothetical protein